MRTETGIGRLDAGYAVFMAVILTLILSIIAATFLTVAYNYYYSAEQYYLDAKGLYAAEAGRVYAHAKAWGNINLQTLSMPDITVGDAVVTSKFTKPDKIKEEYILDVTSKVP